jgi:hypothetical protein
MTEGSIDGGGEIRWLTSDDSRIAPFGSQPAESPRKEGRRWGINEERSLSGQSAD